MFRRTPLFIIILFFIVLSGATEDIVGKYPCGNKWYEFCYPGQHCCFGQYCCSDQLNCCYTPALGRACCVGPNWFFGATPGKNPAILPLFAKLN
uniref:Cysteine rich secreted protein n=1 Tax=Riptortus pedestris TaxID=329032 RepID=R4WR90_RIPPE|nr:cysteine rich secreted protein [Riptortus pedestris]